MHDPLTEPHPRLPSVDAALRSARGSALAAHHGHDPVVEVLREVLAEARAARLASSLDELLDRAAGRLAARHAPGLRAVFNLTGTVLHTNLGRAPLPQVALDAIAATAGDACNLEYDLEDGRRGERDHVVEGWLCRLTGAEAALVVNNNAAAVLLLLNALAQRREVVVSRGELVEIGGAFRIPDVMARAGARLREVGTTNRTHTADYAAACSERTALLMKVHTSNYAIAGFTASVDEATLAALAHERGLPFVVDLGSGTLVDLSRYGLPREPTVRDALVAGADLVTFSGDKLLGGPQCGIVAGRADLVARLRRNPLKRALRVGKLTLAALGAVLRLYADPARLPERLPAQDQQTRGRDDIAAQAARLAPAVSRALAGIARVECVDCHSQIGSGALPVDLLPSVALRLAPLAGGGRAPERLAARLRALPRPVIGRVHEGALLLDLRCLDDEAAFLAQIDALAAGSSA